MELKELRDFTETLSCLLDRSKSEKLSVDLAPFLELVQSTKECMESLLIEHKQWSEYSQISLSGQSSQTEERQPLNSCENNYQQSNIAAFHFESPIEILRKEKSVVESRTKPRTYKVNFSSRRLIIKKEKLLFLMENLRQIIRYQNKIEKNCFVQTHISMTDIQERFNTNPFTQNNQQRSFHHDNEKSHSKFSNTLEQLFQDCHQFESNLQKYQSKQAKRDIENNSENTDKRSLLTQMIKASQIISDMQDFEQIEKHPVHHQNHRSMSVSANKLTARSEKKLLKEIDFTDYKIESIRGGKKKEKKAKLNNCGQCSQCRIF